MQDLEDLFKLLAWMDSCEVRGHTWVKMWTGSGSEDAPEWVPVTCSRCGVAVDR